MVSCAACLRRQTYRLAGPSTCRALHSSHPPPAREDFQSHRVDLHDPSDLLGYRGPDGRSGFGFRPSHHPSDQSRFNNGVGIYVRHPDDLKPPPVHEPDPAWICSQFAETPRNTRATGSSRITGTDQWLLKRMNEEAELEDGIDFDSSSTAESSSSTMDTGTYIRAPIPKRPERRKILPKFDPLPVDEYAYSRDPQTGSINAGMVRHNWRSRSRSGVDKKGRDTEKAEGDKWFPDLPGRREDPPMIRLDHGVTFRSELDKYTDYFEPLLDAEHQEEKARYKRKLRETPVDQLQRLGVTLSRLHPVPSPVQPKSGCYVDFKHLDKQGNPLDLPGHLFELRKSVLISTKLPLDSSTIHGMVISIGRNFIRVRVDRSSFETMPPVQYRMDMGMSDHVYKVQRQAIRLMNLDPIAEDAETSLYMVHQDLRKVMAPLPHTAPSSQERSPQNEGSGEEPEPIIKRERALHGTALRHSLLRAFQERFVPYHASAGAMPFTPSTDVLPVPEKNDSIGAEVVTSRSKIENANSTHSILYRAPEPDESHLLYFNQQIQSWIRRHLRENPVRCEGDPRISLNPSQIRAIAMMLSKKLSLIQGPPGTGKTRVIIEAINLLKVNRIA
ncbi:hypothetical protein BD324DRAFT_72477 [Kockovaella imperatae]|uniref:DNA2/NAM7 helicase helicase domain-containing protein n=1 Tax=Kockovaella imperatae TaxID=4999 RepID=A0A1Y1UCH5_9TREE|nr:hypothetical protein BD324DRAFT_72477 [Kockovaella imperatae]ORX35702.1 hypothetical protein BD324DRAFT_72477 [Kockovaella imperatae]